MKTNLENEPESLIQKTARRMENLPTSFIREMLKTAAAKNSISFAGGLPNENLIPVTAFQKSFDRAVRQYGSKIFQYASSEGFLPLKEWIAQRYHLTHGMLISPENILITNGSQQAFDLVGKVFLDPGNAIIVEDPGYLGALQSFGCFQPSFLPIALDKHGMNIKQLEKVSEAVNPKLLHIVPNFQNPTGMSYADDNKRSIFSWASRNDTCIVEDDPYHEIYFDAPPGPPLAKMLPDKTILLGSFSKTLSPGMRLGWLVAPRQWMRQLVVAKQASDLHTSNLSQMMTYEYLRNYDYDEHLDKIRKCYAQRKNVMIEAIKDYFPAETSFTDPAGGMFVWCALPEVISVNKLLRLSMDAGVVFVPGNVFSIGNSTNAIRLNFSHSSEEEIKKGIRIIGKTMSYLFSKKHLIT